MTNKYLTAIIFLADPAAPPQKYRNIVNSQRALESFQAFAKTKKAKYINYYDRQTRAYMGRVYIG